MTSKQRAHWRAQANKIEATMQIGKLGVTPEAVTALDEMLTARELVKLTVLPSCDTSPMDAAEMLSGRTRSQVVQVIGKKIVLYREAK
jgi:RNA-binding protein